MVAKPRRTGTSLQSWAVGVLTNSYSGQVRDSLSFPLFLISTYPFYASSKHLGLNKRLNESNRYPEPLTPPFSNWQPFLFEERFHVRHRHPVVGKAFTKHYLKERNLPTCRYQVSASKIQTGVVLFLLLQSVNPQGCEVGR